jgi:beta-lactamase class D
MKRILLYCFTIIGINSFAQKMDTINLQSYFGDFKAAFCLYDINTNSYIQFNTEQCKKRYSPCSTFKIPNSLIGIETGVIPDTGYIIKYDSILHPFDSFKLANEPFKYWYQDLSLKKAFKYSCVWYYQELARRVGKDKMKYYVDKLNYGNKDISSGLDSYWLCGSMEISINEQVEFLKKMYLYQLTGFSAKTIDAVKNIMLYEATKDYKLYGKTGGGDCWDDKFIGWYVGFVETNSGTKIFAMNVLVGNNNNINYNYRIEVTKKILKGLKIIK